MQRPASVTVFGILNILFAVLGVIGILFTMAMFARMDAAQNPMVKLMQDSPAFAMWIKLSLPLGIASTAVLLLAGIGLLMMKGWARKLSVGYAVYAIVFGLLGTAVNFYFLLLPALDKMSGRVGPEEAAAIGGAIGGTIGGCIGIIHPVLLLIFMTRPKVGAAFSSANAPPVIPEQ